MTVPQAHKELLKLLIEAGLTRMELAQTLGVSYDVICNRVSRWNLPTPQRASTIVDPVITTRNTAIVAMYMEGHTLNQVGQKYDLTRERVRQIIAKQGYSPRQSAGRKRLTKFKPTPIDRFWRLVKKGQPDECWPYADGIRVPKHGHKYIWFRGKHYTVRQVAFFLANKRWSDKLIGTTCKTKQCLNPAHFVEGDTTTIFVAASPLYQRNKRLGALPKAPPLSPVTGPITGISFGVAARQFGVQTCTLRHWEQRGVIPKAHRNERGWRICTPDWILAVQAYRENVAKIDQELKKKES